MSDLLIGENRIGRFYLPPNDAISTTIISGAVFDADVVEFIESYSGDVALDVGANIGQMTVLMSRLFKEVYAFEANPTVAAILQKNLELNNAKNVKIVTEAVWDETGVHLPFPEPDGRYESLGSYGIKPKEIGARKIRSIKIDDFNLKKVGLMKFDIQGADLKGMKGATKTIETSKPDIVFEYEPLLVGDFNESMADYLSFIHSINYKPYRQLRENMVILPSQK